MADITSPLNANGHLIAAAPLDGTKAGFNQFNYVLNPTTSRAAKITEEGEAWSASSRLLFSTGFNGAAAGALINSQFNQQLTTMTTALNGGFLRFNSGAIVTANTGVSVYTWRVFSIEDGSVIRMKAFLRHTQGAIANKQFDLGFGYYDVAANQAAAMNEFAGFRWTQAGALVGVLEYSVGGAPTTITTNINGGVPYSDSVSRSYEVVVTDNGVEFWVGGVYQASIAFQPDAPGVLKAAGYPAIARLFIGGSAASAPVFDLGGLVVTRIGFEADVPVATRQALMGRHSSRNQAGLSGTAGGTASVPATGVAPTATAGSNTAATIPGLGGFYRLTATNAGAAHANTILSAYQNPLVPETAGAASDARNLLITDLFIGTPVVTTTLVGGGTTWEYFIATGATAASLATADATGAAAIGTKSAVITPLALTETLAAAAAAGTVPTRVGDSSYSFATPIPVAPGEFFVVGIRTLFATAAITAGVLDGGIGVSGYWG